MPATKASWYLLQVLGLVSIVFVTLVIYNPTYGRRVSARLPTPTSLRLSSPNFASLLPGSYQASSAHAIDQLVQAAQIEFNALRKKEVKSLSHAAQEYRKKRNRHPPPGFDRWYHYATEHGALLVEDFFDQIYHDLAPFWSVRPYELRRQAKGYRPRISVRNGMVSGTPNVDASRMIPWNAAIEELKAYLPDLDIPLNMNDEPALVVPWPDVDEMVSNGRHFMLSPTEILDEFSGRRDIDYAKPTFKPDWLSSRRKRPDNALGELPYWSLVKPACPPNSAAGAHETWNDIWSKPGSFRHHYANVILPTDFPNGSLNGYARNWSTATDPCSHPYLQGLYGGFVRPRFISASQQLFPLFSGSKFAINNDILLPSPEDWNASLKVDDGIPPSAWAEKESVLFWRGPATGGQNTKRTWRRSHRQRFVSMLHPQQIALAEETLDGGDDYHVKGVGPAENFKLLPQNQYNLFHQPTRSLSKWVESWANVAFTNMVCVSKDKEINPAEPCSYNENFFPSVAEPVSEEVMHKYKYIPILDGDAYPDSFLDVLKSGSVPIRASLFKTWLDSRLVPWVHFVPMDNTFVDLYGIMEYFLGTYISGAKDDNQHPHGSRPRTAKTANAYGHDESARKIAAAGREWAKTVLRKEDMLIYIWRLLLEYARVVDDKRERMGWVGDLIGDVNGAG